MNIKLGEIFNLTIPVINVKSQTINQGTLNRSAIVNNIVKNKKQIGALDMNPLLLRHNSHND
jgi:hypothetical protein